MKRFIILLILQSMVAMLVVLNSCSHKRPQVISVNPAFGRYVSGYTAGNISRRSNIRIELAQPYTGKHKKTGQALPDSAVLEDIFEFEPRLKGRAVWLNDRVIEFIPAEPMPVNQFYTVSFDLDKVAKVEDEFETFVYQFATYPQNMSLEFAGLRNYDDFNTEYLKFSGKVRTSDYADSLQVRTCFKARINKKEVPLQWVRSYNNYEFYFYIDSIQRGVEKGSIEISWDGEPLKSLSKGSEFLEVSAMGDFSVSDVKVIDDDDQSLELYFGEPIAYKQDLNGIITLEGVDHLTYSIEGNLVKVYPGKRILGEKELRVSTGIKSAKGFNMNEAFVQSLTFEAPKPQVKLIGSGSILPNSGGLIFPFRSISLKAVDVRVIKIYQNNIHQFLQLNDLDGEDGLTRVGKVIAEKKFELDGDKNRDLNQWNTHVIDLSKLITPDPGAIYRVSIKFNKAYTNCNCADQEESSDENTEEEEAPSVMSIPVENDKEWSEYDWYRYSFDGGYETWSYYDDDYSVCNNRYYYGKAVSRNILASDLGMIYKLDENKRAHAFISDMITAKPLSGCVVEYFDYTRQLIAKGTTDAGGMLVTDLKQKPFLMVASYGRQKGYLKLLDGKANSLSKFDIEGELVQKGVKGMIYGERGVWRPGDSLYLNFILEDKEHHLPANHPVQFELQDPNGKVVSRFNKTENVNGLYDFRTATSDDAVTGTYLAVVRVGNRTFSQAVKIETVKPNRLKLYFDVNTAQISEGGRDTIAQLRAQWLHGAIAKNLRAVVNVSMHQTETSFDGYKNYVFDSPLKNYSGEEMTVFDGMLNKDGKAGIPAIRPTGRTAPGMLRASFVTRVFEEGGDFSVDRFSVLYSPYQTYIGLRVPETGNYNDALETEKSYTFDVVSADASGKAKNADQLQVRMYRLQWRWWYESDEEDLSTYITRSSTVITRDTILKTINGKANFKFRVSNEEYGRYLVVVTDMKGGHQTGKVVTVDWPYWSRGNRAGQENSTMLNFSCDKTQYQVGEDIKVTFPSPSNGQALLSVETGTKVIKKIWIPTQSGETRYILKATEEMSPNAYIHITLLQPHVGTKNDLPIRLYGVVPVRVDDPHSHLKPLMVMADVWKPESRAGITVREEQGRPMTYTLAVVDEGLLDLTRFKTPQPWNTFYAREALGVKTWDMYDAVIGAYAGKLDHMLSIGGDGSGSSGKSVKANRFKPMVRFIGPFSLGAGKQNNHFIDIPNYCGSVRVMLVAEDNGAYGNVEKAVAVKKPLMVLATLPRVLGPQETVQLPVDVFAMENHVKDVKIEIEVNEMLSIEGSRQQSIHFDRTGDEVVNFKLNVASATGIARVKVIARSGKEVATEEIEIEVRVSNPRVVDAEEFTLAGGKSLTDQIRFRGLKGTNKVVVEVSSIPSLGLEQRLEYLIEYPHGCIEQTTSAVFPQLFVGNLVELKEFRKEEIMKNVKAGLKRLQLFQTSNGGFAYWPGEADDNEWGSNYAGHFMLEAEKQGYTLPVNLKSRWITYQKIKAKNWNNEKGVYTHPHGDESYQHIQAYRLFVLALCNNAELGAMNRMREERNLGQAAKWRLAAAYQLAGQPDVAAQMVSTLPTDVTRYRELSYSYGSELRDEAMILETLALMKEKTRSAAMVKRVVSRLNDNNWMSTQETAYNLLAISEYTGANNSSSFVSYNIGLGNTPVQKQQSKKMISTITFTEAGMAGKNVLKLNNTGNGNLYIKVMTEGIPLIGDNSAKASQLKMAVNYKNMKGEPIQVEKLIQGQDFLAEITITNPGNKGYYREMTLNQIFPSGWEIHNNRLDEQNGIRNDARYQDIRDDRVYSYYDLPAGETKTFTVKLNATYLGRFYLPTVYSEAMYDQSINARIPGRWVEVVKDPGYAMK